MSRRVRQYLDTLTHESSEDALHALSLQWEPSNNTGESLTHTRAHPQHSNIRLSAEMNFLTFPSLLGSV